MYAVVISGRRNRSATLSLPCRPSELVSEAAQVPACGNPITKHSTRTRYAFNVRPRVTFLCPSFVVLLLYSLACDVVSQYAVSLGALFLVQAEEMHTKTFTLFENDAYTSLAEFGYNTATFPTQRSNGFRNPHMQMQWLGSPPFAWSILAYLLPRWRVGYTRIRSSIDLRRLLKHSEAKKMLRPLERIRRARRVSRMAQTPTAPKINNSTRIPNVRPWQGRREYGRMPLVDTLSTTQPDSYTLNLTPQN